MRRSTESPDGYFKLFYKKGWAYLCVFPPSPHGKPAYPEEIRNRMRILKVPAVEQTKILDIIDEASGLPVPLVEWPDGADLASRVKVDISEDRMTAFAIIEAPKKGAAPPSLLEINGELEAQGVLLGIESETIKRILSMEEYGTRFQAANGTPPIFGKSRKLKYHFNTDRGRPWLLMDFDRINLKELNFIENVKKDDLLAELLPPITAADGYTVTGETLPAATDEETTRIISGANTRLEEEGVKLYAEIDGNAKIVKGAVVVEPVVTVDNVNYETGNIKFDGSVVVKNGVADGFIVEAGGDIQVGKGVGRARLSAGGNVLLKAGMSGAGEGRLECGGNLVAKYIESASVLCRGHAIIEEAVMHSALTVWKQCALNGKRSEIIGGSCIVGGSLWCKKLGSMYDTPTVVAMGVTPDILLAYRESRKKLDEIDEDKGKVEEQLKLLEKAQQEGNANERVIRAREQLSGRYELLSTEAASLKSEVAEMRENLKASRKSMLVVEDIMYKGVVVLFGTMEFRVPDKGLRKTILKISESGVTESGFNPSDKLKLEFEE